MATNQSGSAAQGRTTRTAKLAVAGAAGLLLILVAPGLVGSTLYAYRKATGPGDDCSWAQTLAMPKNRELLEKLRAELLAEPQEVDKDEENGLVLVRTRSRDFWVRKDGTEMGGKEMISYLLVEHRWMQAMNPREQVQKGDVVIDCGAHVGVFTHYALEHGAAKVVAVEPHPQNVLSLRRNFAKEIAEGRVVVVPKGVWSSETTLKLYTAKHNSGMNSFVLKDGDDYVEVPLVRLDSIVQSLGLKRVDYIKMDIEGAEREALSGAANTLKTWKPRVMLDFYHRPDDPQVLPRVIAAARPDYSQTCGPCEDAHGKGRLEPHVMYLH